VTYVQKNNRHRLFFQKPLQPLETTQESQGECSRCRARARRGRFLLVALVGVFIGLYIDCSPFIAKPLFDLLLFPNTGRTAQLYKPSTIQGITSQDRWIKTDDGRKLHAWLFEKPGAATTTVVHHGQGGPLTCYMPFVELVLAQNSSVLLYDYEGYGLSEGYPCLERLVVDGRAAHDYVRRTLRIPASNIVEFGISLGTGVACNVSKERDSAGVVLMSPYASIFATAKHAIPFLHAYPEWTWPYKDIESLSFVAHKHPPVLMFHGGQDGVIPIEQADALARGAESDVRYVRYPRARHVDFLNEHLEQTSNELARFFRKVEHLRDSSALSAADGTKLTDGNLFCRLQRSQQKSNAYRKSGSAV
jgi:alpha-beta hydrolase superfamily lysophospholipase